MEKSPEELLRNRFGSLTEIQEKAISVVASGANVLIIAPTGYGKTEAALLPVLDNIKSQQGIAALYITPLRSLNRDLLRRFKEWCTIYNITSDIRHGDTTISERAKQRKNPPQIVLTTIESLQALLVAPIMRKHLQNVRYVIVDEIHDVLDNKRGAQLSLSLERLARIASFSRIGISATLPNPTEAAALLFGQRDYKVIEAGSKRTFDFSVFYEEEREKRLEKIKSIVEKERSLLFVNTRSTAEEIGGWLKEKKAPIEVHHGSLSKEVRVSAEDDFKTGKIKSLVCTSSLELGIDVGDVDLIVQYGSPHQVFRLIQRVGRSGHSIRKVPKGIVFPLDFDDFLEAEAIVSLAQNGWVERKTIEKGALDVIAHQIIGLLLENYKMHFDEIHSIFKESGAYGITIDKLKSLLLQLHAESLVFFNQDGTIKVRNRARDYYYTYLSTIPKTKKFVLFDSSSNRQIASLDEEFVSNITTGDNFLSKGQVWEVLDITEDAVVVSPGTSTEITIPSWIGEDIPVAKEIAEMVGAMRKIKIKEQVVPDDKTIVIEVISDVIVVHSCFGNKINETIGRIFAYLISEIIGESVRAVADAYRIIIKLPYPIEPKKINDVFMSCGISPRKKLEESLRNSNLLRFKFSHVARMFGLIEEDATVGQKFIDALRYSVVYEETIRSIFFRYFDLDGAEEIFKGIKSRKIKVVLDERKTPSFFAQIGLNRVSAREAIGIFEPKDRIIAALKEKILSYTKELVCLNCGATRFVYLASAEEELKCAKCGKKALALKSRSADDMELSAALIQTYGKKALIALSVYGIGPVTAERILARLHKDENSFYLDLIEAQKTFVKTKKYWKV
ncbi:MAG: DEAD/DEAH box helicase [Candidatus Bilamarchaeaceae archaeon]